MKCGAIPPWQRETTIFRRGPRASRLAREPRGALVASMARIPLEDNFNDVINKARGQKAGSK